MRKESITFGIAGLIIGFLLGILVEGKLMERHGVPVPLTAQSGGAMLNPAAMNTRIAELARLALKDPTNAQGWAALGNAYFDAHNPQKAVQAYAKALQLNPNDPNVLTDQGVMFRALGFFDKALDNFEKANRLNPHHLQSLFNSGIVYAVDLKQPAKARPIFEQVARLAGGSDLGNQARDMLQQLPK